MRKLLMTSALVVPLMAMPALAQEAPPLIEDETDEQAVGTETNGTEADAPVAAEDAETDEPAVADDPAAEDPALADDPAAEDPAVADDPAAEDPTVADDPAAAPLDEPAVAEDPEVEDPAVAEDAAPSPDAPLVTEMRPSELRGDWIIGTSVTSPQDETIGSIQDLIIDEEEGRVTAAVLSVGGFLGIGAKNIAVDWNELQIDHDAREITLNLTREEADAAPEYMFRDQAEAPAPPMGAEPPPMGADPAAPPPPTQ